MFVLHMRSKLYLGLKSTKLTSFLEGDRVGAIQDIIPSLQHRRKQKASGAWENNTFRLLTRSVPGCTLSAEQGEMYQPTHSDACRTRQAIAAQQN